MRRDSNEEDIWMNLLLEKTSIMNRDENKSQSREKRVVRK